MVDCRERAGLGARVGWRSSSRGGLRTFALILILLGTVVLGYDAVIFLDRGAFPMTQIGSIWASIHRDSLLLLQPAIERHVHPALWEWVIFPILQQSAAVVLIGLGVAILLLRALARRRARRREGFSFKRR
jgi:hypothetical protein